MAPAATSKRLNPAARALLLVAGTLARATEKLSTRVHRRR